MELWNYGLMELRINGITESRINGLTESRNHGLMESRNYGIAESRNHGTTGIEDTLLSIPSIPFLLSLLSIRTQTPSPAADGGGRS